MDQTCGSNRYESTKYGTCRLLAHCLAGLRQWWLGSPRVACGPSALGQLSGSALGAAPAVPAGSAFGSLGSLGSLESLAGLPFLAVACWWVMLTSPLSSMPTTMVSPALYLKRSSSSDRGSSMRRWMTRRNGRAP